MIEAGKPSNNCFHDEISTEQAKETRHALVGTLAWAHAEEVSVTLLQGVIHKQPPTHPLPKGLCLVYTYGCT